MENYKNTNIGEIVTRDFRAAEIFKNAGIDFCCGGSQSLEQACLEMNIDKTVLETELAKLERTTVYALHNFNEWNLDFLCDLNSSHKCNLT